MNKDQDSSLFNYSDYKKYLLNREKTWIGRGMRKDLSVATNCQKAYVSQVLNADKDFSLEQAEGANAFLGHSKLESTYFLLLVQLARAGTEGLKQHVQDQLKEVRVRALDLRNRIEIQNTLSPEHQMTYYSDPYYAIVHVALTIPELQTPSSLGKRLGVTEARLAEILEFLSTTGLVEKQGQKYKVGQTRIHLGHDSKMILAHHRNWRLKTIDNFSLLKATDLHYSSLVSISQKDFEQLRETLTRTIDRVRKVVRASPEEDLIVFNLDLFQLKR